MRLNFKKVSAIVASALMVGLTMGSAAAANYPNPFVVGGAADVAVVYGTGTGVSSLDLVQAGNIQANLQSFMGGTSGSTPSVSGEAFALFTGGTKIYMNDSLNAVTTVLTKSQLPTLLADTSFSGNVDATIYQKIDLGSNPKVLFKKQPTSDDDPNYALATSTTQTSYIYNATATFSKAVNFSHADSEGEDITLFGMDFTISSATDGDTIVLLKSAEKVVLSSDTPAIDAVVGGKTYTFELVSASDTAATIKVTDKAAGTSESKEIDESSSKKVNGITVAVTTADETNLKLTATIVAGTEKITLEDGVSVAIGDSDDTVDGTLVDFGSGNPNNLTSLTISVYAPESDKDAVIAGGSFADPVYGTFKLDFTGLNIATDSTTSREKIALAQDGDTKMSVKFTDSRNYEKTFTFAVNKTSMFLMNDEEGRNISVKERELVHKGEFAVVGNEDEGRLLKLSSVQNQTADAGTGYSNSKVEFQDVFSGETIKTTWTSDGKGTAIIAGKSYDVRYWGSRGLADTSYNISIDFPDSTGNSIAIIYPTIQTSKGAKVAFYEPLMLNLSDWDGRNGSGIFEGNAGVGPVYNLTSIYIPDGDGYEELGITWTRAAVYDGAFNLSYDGLTNVNFTTSNVGGLASNASVWNVGGLRFNISSSAGNTTDIHLMRASGAQVNIDNPALIVWEEKDDNTNYNAIIIELDDGSTGNHVGVQTTNSGPTWVNNSATWRSTKHSDNKFEDTADLWGTIVTFDSTDTDQSTAVISYPDEQLYANLYIGKTAATITGGTAGGAASLGDVLIKDTEIEQFKTKNLIVVGGSCINSVAAKLVGVPACGADFTAKTGIGTGQFLIQSFGDAYTTGKIALLVAGYEAADTVNAATYLRTKTVNTAKGTKYKGTSAIAAELVTTNSTA